MQKLTALQLGITNYYEISLFSRTRFGVSRVTIDTPLRDKKDGFYLAGMYNGTINKGSSLIIISQARVWLSYK
jgi:hypothetical protein